MRFVLLLAGGILLAEYLKHRTASTAVQPNNQRIGLIAPRLPEWKARLLVQNEPITEAAYNQDASVKYTPAFGAIENEGEEYIL